MKATVRPLMKTMNNDVKKHILYKYCISSKNKYITHT